MGKTTFIYALCEPNSRTVRYIGKADRLKRRFQQHLSQSVRAKTHLGTWLRSLLGEKPTLVVLREVLGNGSEAERRFIRLARGCRMNLVNGTDGGDGLFNPSPETRAKLSAAMLGKKHSPETKLKMSVQKTGGKHPHFGKPRSDKQKALCSAALSGNKHPQFGKTGSASPSFGRKHTEEEKLKMRIACALRKAEKV